MSIEIVAEERLVDIVAEGYDAGIRFDDAVPKDMIAVPVGPHQRFAVVGAPAYFHDRTPPLTPEDLKNHSCIRWRYTGGGFYKWEFEKNGEAQTVAVDGPLAATDNGLMLRAALDGIGLAFLFEQQVAAHVASGRLIRVLEDWCPSYPGFHIYYPSRRQVHPGLRAFIEILRPK